MLFGPRGRSAVLILRGKYYFGHITYMCSSVANEMLFGPHYRKAFLVLQEKPLLATRRKCAPDIVKEMWFLPHDRDAINWLQKSQCALHMADIQQTWRCKLEMFPPCSFIVKKRNVTFSTLLQWSFDKSRYLGVKRWFTHEDTSSGLVLLSYIFFCHIFFYKACSMKQLLPLISIYTKCGYLFVISKCRACREQVFWTLNFFCKLRV